MHAYEDECLLSLHLNLLTRRILRVPIRVILFEPILAGCGGILSARCYKILAKLAEIHGVVFIIDEILSFGRMGYDNGLYCMQHMPPEMHKYVFMITVGKWLGYGMILKRSAPPVEGHKETEESFARVVSTKINVTNIIKTWNSVFSKIGMIPSWREHVLDYVGVTNTQVGMGEDNHWGDGLLIFLAGKMANKEGATSGLHSRFLPKINSDETQIKKILTRATKSSFVLVDGWDRASINIDLVTSIRGYCYPNLVVDNSIPYRLLMFICNLYQQMGIHPPDPRNLGKNEKRQTAYDRVFYDFLHSVQLSGIVGNELSASRLRTAITKLINDACVRIHPKSDVLQHMKIGKNRLTVWRAGCSMVYWQQLLVDQSDSQDLSEPANGGLICLCTTCTQRHGPMFLLEKPPKRRKVVDDEAAGDPASTEAEESSVARAAAGEAYFSDDEETVTSDNGSIGMQNNDCKPRAK